MINDNQELFRFSFDSIYKAGNRSTRSGAVEPLLENIQKGSTETLDSAGHLDLPLTAADADEYAIQRPIRQWFGKVGINRSKIGAHPDFEHLDGTDELMNHHITTMFIDIKDSTRLSLRYELRQVQKIKNAILRAASETVRALDGHVHRFMGDALMAYFGGVNQDRESACMAAINCAAMLRLLMEESISPGLLRQGIDPGDIGFRVGLDYGDDVDVLWSSYGYTDVSEVTATSFYVDSAAKLQAMASKDKAMLGANLVQHIDLPEYLTGQKTEISNGKIVLVPYLRPNYTLLEGGSHDYEIHELKFNNLVRLLPIPLNMRARLVSTLKAHPGIEFRAAAQDTHLYSPYSSLSRCVNKETDIQFQIIIQPQVFDGLRMPLRAVCVRRNHGQEAIDAEMTDDERIVFELRPSASSYGRKPKKHHWTRVARYRGIHTVEVKIFDASDTLLFCDIIGVHVR